MVPSALARALCQPWLVEVPLVPTRNLYAGMASRTSATFISPVVTTGSGDGGGGADAVVDGDAVVGVAGQGEAEAILRKAAAIAPDNPDVVKRLQALEAGKNR